LDAGGIRRFEKAIDVSNVAILDPKLDVPTRVGYKVIDGKKVRYAKKSGEVIDG
jgi:large subunit ribosomal protein L24